MGLLHLTRVKAFWWTLAFSLLHDDAMADTKRVILLGKTGSGKSSLGNTIFGDDSIFTVNDTPNSETSVCRSVTRRVHGRNLKLIDTGFFDTDPNRNTFKSQFKDCLKECSPGIHAFLLVLKVERYTAQEKAVVDLILQYFSPEALRYTTVVFTHGDSLPTGKSIADWAQENKALKHLLEKCGNRCHVIDNQYWKNQGEIYRNNQNQVQDLLNTIDLAVAANGGTPFTTDLLRNPYRWEKLRDAPIGVQISAILGVSAVGCLLYTVVPWAQISEWVMLGSKNGPYWIWQNLPTEEAIKSAVVYLSSVEDLFQKTLKIAVILSIVSNPIWATERHQDHDSYYSM